LVWFGSDFILEDNRTKSNRILFYLAVRMTFNLKTEPNRTANTPSMDYNGKDQRCQATKIGLTYIAKHD